MATSEENNDLIEDIKRPIRHYRIVIWGYGGESAYLGLSKEQYDYWKKRQEESEDAILNYMLDEAREDFTDVPPEMDFMKEDDYVFPWYEAPAELEHQYGVDYNSAYISVDDLVSEDYRSDIIDSIVDNEQLNDWIDELQEEDDYATELVEMEISKYEEWAAPYILQFHSSEKGTFFEGIITTAGKFNPKKLRILTTEYANGEDTITTIQYDGEEIDNFGAETNGKGYNVHMWENN